MERRGKGKRRKTAPLEKQPPPWLDLPVDIWGNILHRLGAIEIMRTAEKVCTTWWRVCKDPSLWRVIDMCSIEDHFYLPDDFEKMCRHAVDLSQGELVDINLEFLSTDELLSYVVDRSGKLKRLSIGCCCYGMTCERLVELLHKLPLLEELSLTLTTITTNGAIEALGRSCPQLKSLKLNNWFFMGSDAMHGLRDARNDQALFIAKILPSLHHLQLIENSMTNEGLIAILDGCPNLVSLDLRMCTNVSFDQVLSSRVSRIKDVKRPDDPLEFEPWVEDDDVYVDGLGHLLFLD